MSNPTIWLQTLGCAKNQVDSEKVLAMAAEAGYALAGSPEDADVVMVNTCAFVEEARAESVDAILDLEGRRKPGSRSIVIGCMAQRFGSELEQALPEVDAVVGIDRYGELVGILDRLTGWQPVQIRRRPVMDILHAVGRPASGLPYAYLKVAEGCDKPCTFCAIPKIRGRQRSRRPHEIRQEAEGLVRSGVGEIVLVAQDLAAYGRDLEDAPRRPDIVDLLSSLSEIEGLHTLRLLYLYPKEIRPALISEIAGNPKVASYFDLSLQHASRRLLRAMKRPGGSDAHLRLIDDIRAAAPDAALRSSFIVGFPSETEDDVDELATFLQTAQLDWAGFFPYSPEEGTPAADLSDRVEPETVGERLRFLQNIQEEITASHNAAQVGKRVEVLVDQIEEGTPVGRSYRQAPEIDGVVLLDAGAPGDRFLAEVTAAFGADLEARRVDP